ncbi:ACT domain-containing protein ACR1-like [Vicia villosa]|uniref:ACT domain-containing protein ACR1-like n=1 Tax=Vicia villosa TaxID=3911 RepID=UPI00273C30C2|nr:ACT domain-containing protein ACR1-like [Vicia villosa]
MVQALTDLDLIISKSYISSDGGWIMDVFHLKDQIGNKVTDNNLVHHIQQNMKPSEVTLEKAVELLSVFMCNGSVWRNKTSSYG